ncbi:glycoside hydrolase family 15 [Candidatus Woesearchaeota archaeon]|nr:glycoside hydrolase family 15 [Candidatus Woesearchaeota archaeon]
MILTNSLALLNKLRHETGLFSAAGPCVTTGYHRAWVRDNLYMAIGLEAIDPQLVIPTYHALLDILKKHEYKIDWAIKEKPRHRYQYIHARYDPLTMEEIPEEWGNKQNDAIGLLLFKVGDLMDRGFPVIRDIRDLRVLGKLVKYLASIEYWQDADNGVWEENEEVHASSIGACVAGLRRIASYVRVPSLLIEKGQHALNQLLPRESITKETDLALLSLIWPFDVVTREQRDAILRNVEEKLLRERGVLRYVGDQYYNKKGEAEWTMGLPWLALINRQIGNVAKYRYYLEKTHSAINENGELPELYFANITEHNENTPLGWSHALYMVAVKGENHG